MTVGEEISEPVVFDNMIVIVSGGGHHALGEVVIMDGVGHHALGEVVVAAVQATIAVTQYWVLVN